MKPLVTAWMAMAIVALGCGRERARTNPPKANEVSAPARAADPPPVPDSRPGTAGGELVEGTVLEVLQVPKYTYLKLKTRDARERWAAIATKAVEAGSTVSILAETTLTHFESKALHRTFDEVAFGSIYEPPADGTACPAGDFKTVDLASSANAQHAAVPNVETPVALVTRAAGANGFTVSEIIAKRKALVGRRVRLHATVVKATYDVLGKSFVHLRDGTGDAKAGTLDVTATTGLRPKQGDTMLLEGTLAVDKDFGAGYRYDALIEDAVVPP